MKYRPDKNQITWAMTLFFTCIALAVAIYLLFHLGPIFTWLKKVMDILQGVFYGVVIAYVLSPIVNLTEQKWLIPYYENKGVLFYAPENRTIRSRTRIVSVVIAIFVATVMLVGLLGIVIPQLIQSITVLLNSVPSYLDNVNNWINQMQAVSDGNNEILNELQESARPGRMALFWHGPGTRGDRAGCAAERSFGAAAACKGKRHSGRGACKDPA